VAEGTRLLSEYGVSNPIEGSNPSLSVSFRSRARFADKRRAMPVSFSIADSSDGPRKVVIWVTGDLDADTGRAVRARLAQAQRHARSDVILDLTGVTFVDSVALTSIVNGARSMNEVGHLRVISPPARVAQVFTEAGIAEVFDLTPDRRGERVDRRTQDIPVAFDRRQGDRRRMSENPATPVERDPAATLDDR
jgi:anti-anti-sigma factor